MERDDSKVAEFGGVTFAILTRASICVMWCGFWACRVYLTDALDYRFTEPVSIAVQLLGTNPFDQGFAIGMAIMTVQVARIVWFYILGGIMGILLPTSKGLAERVAKRLSPDRFEAIAMEKLTPDRFEAIAMQKLTPDRFEAIAMQKLTPDRLRQLAEQQEREAEEQLPA